MNLIRKTGLTRFITAIATIVFIASTASVSTAALIDLSLAGNTSTDRWTSAALSAGVNSGFPGFPGTGVWPRPIESVSGGDAQLIKISNGTSGGPYAASGSIYFGGTSGDINNNGGTLAVVDNTPVANLANVLFQIEIGEAWTYDFFDHELPTLTYSTASGDVSLEATSWKVIEQVFTGTITMPTGEENLYNNTYLLQWDLSSVSEEITSFSISFTGVQHAQVYSLQLDQSDVYTQYPLLAAAIPEPATYAAIVGGFILMGTFLARRRRTP